MKNISKTVRVIALAAGAAVCATSAFAGGQLGARSVGISYIQTDFDDTTFQTGRGAQVDVNMPVAKFADISVSYTFLDSDLLLADDLSFDLEGHEVAFAGAFYYATSRYTPYIKPGIARSRVKCEGHGVHACDYETTYDIEVGVEVPVGDRVVFTPFIGSTDGFHADDESTFRYGATVEAALTPRLSVLFGVSDTNDRDLTVTVGSRIRF